MNDMVELMVDRARRGRDFVWEVPGEAKIDRTSFLGTLRKQMVDLNLYLYDFYVDGCAFQMKAAGVSVWKRYGES